jgi:hypothetical protein
MPIAPAGRVAAFVTAASCVAIGIGLASLVADATTCRDPSCHQEAAGAWLTILLALGIAVLGAAIARSARRRPLEADGATGWFWGLGAVFLLSSIGVAMLVPAATCPMGGRPDPTLELCLSGSDRLPMSSRIWLERLILVAGVAGGVALATYRRRVWVNATTSGVALAGTLVGMLVRAA